jgi:hypothetical protein
LSRPNMRSMALRWIVAGTQRVTSMQNHSCYLEKCDPQTRMVDALGGAQLTWL